MTNEQETIDGVKGEWRTVTKPSEVKIGQRVRYDDCLSEYKSGYEDKKFIEQINGKYCKTWNGKMKWTGTCFLFKPNFWKNIQAFFPLPVHKSRKVAKVKIEERGMYFGIRYTIGGFNPVYSVGMMSRKSAIKSAKRFCKAIGYECEIVK